MTCSLKGPGLRILITGGTGLLGSNFLRDFKSGSDEVFAVGNVLSNENLRFQHLTGPIDVLSKTELSKAFKLIDPDFVIHAAAEGRVDFVQENPEEGWKINVGLTQTIAELSQTHNAKMLFVSSNAVFGKEQGPYNEESPVSPVNIYGELKVEAENFVKENLKDFVILRPILMYGWPMESRRSNPAAHWVNSLRRGEPIKVVNDVWSQPLSVYDCIRLILEVMQSKFVGTLNVSGNDHISLYEFANVVARVFDCDDKLIEGVPSSYFPELAPRPTDTEFDLSKVLSHFQFEPKGVVDGLCEMKLREPVSNR